MSGRICSKFLCISLERRLLFLSRTMLQAHVLRQRHILQTRHASGKSFQPGVRLKGFKPHILDLLLDVASFFIPAEMFAWNHSNRNGTLALLRGSGIDDTCWEVYLNCSMKWRFALINGRLLALFCFMISLWKVLRLLQQKEAVIYFVRLFQTLLLLLPFAVWSDSPKKLFSHLHEIFELFRDVVSLVSVSHHRFHGSHDSVDALRIVTENVNTQLENSNSFFKMNIKKNLVLWAGKLRHWLFSLGAAC